MQVSVACTLRYTLAEETGFVFQIQAAMAGKQTVFSEAISVPTSASKTFFTAYTDPVTLTRVIRAQLGPGEVEVGYQATVNLATASFEPNQVEEFEFTELPMEYLGYIAPSRYCPSDVFSEFAHQTFGAMPRGHSRVVAVCNWIYENLEYSIGSTGSNSTAVDVFQSKQGVCRDFAHLAISLCRALGIPTRYASVYAVAIYPQDFHAVFEAYLKGPNGGAWFSFDPTRMSSVDEIVRIAAGRDAADVAFAWPQGEAKSEVPIVSAVSPGHQATGTTLAVST
jgi:transglutaminase-like putative cysteine protease